MSIISNLFLWKNEFSCTANQCRESIHSGSPHLLCISPGLLPVDYWTLEAILLLFVENYIWRKQAAYLGICFPSTNVALCGENFLTKIIHRNPIGCLGRQASFHKGGLISKSLRIQFRIWTMERRKEWDGLWKSILYIRRGMVEFFLSGSAVVFLENHGNCGGHRRELEREVRAQSWIGVLHFIESFQVCERHRLWKYGICTVGLLPLVIICNSKLCHLLISFNWLHIKKLVFVFWDRVAYSVHQTDLKLRDLLVSASRALRLKACITTTQLPNIKSFEFCACTHTYTHTETYTYASQILHSFHL